MTNESQTLWNHSQTGSVAYYWPYNTPDGNAGYNTSWMCNIRYNATACPPNQRVNATRPWTPHGLNVDHCLSQLVDEHCKIQFSVLIMVVVLSCNFVKTVIMSLIAWKKPTEPLVTLGDAIASFLDEPDDTTRGNCLASKSGFRKMGKWKEVVARWNPTWRHWIRGISTRRFYLCNVL